MKDKKFVANFYQANDAAAMERRLEKLAARGWLLEKATNWGWHLRRGEPKAVKYAVTYFPAASVFDGSVTAGQETYADYCQAAGWEFVSAYGPIQYFRSTRPDPVPIETDEGEKLRTIHRTMLKTLVFSHGLLLVVWLVNLATRISNFSLTPLSTLASNRDLLFLALLVSFVIYLSAMLVDYFIWYARSRRAVERGGACLQPHTRLRFWAGVILMALAVLSLLTTVSEISSPGSAMIWAYAFGGMVLYIALCQGTLALLKRRNLSRGQVRGLFAVIIAVLAIAYTAVIFPIANRLYDSGLMEEREPTQVYTDSRGREWNIYRDDLPLTLEDLGYTVTERDHCSYERKENRSLLADHTVYSQQAVSRVNNLPDLSYQVAVIRWDWLRELALDRLLGGYRRYEQADDPRWGASEVYQRLYSSGAGSYLLLYGDRIVIFDADWPLTDSQIATAVQRLTA